MIQHRTYAVTILAASMLVFGFGGSSASQAIQTGITDTVSQAPAVARDIRNLYTWPHHFGQDWRLHVVPHVSAMDAVAWVLAVTFLAVGLYRIATRSLLQKRTRPKEPERGRRETAQTMTDNADNDEEARPRILRFFIMERRIWRSKTGELTSNEAGIGTGIGFELPEKASKSSHEPQLILIKMGMVYVLIRAIPAKFNRSFFRAGFILWLALSCAVFLHPFARYLGGLASFSQSFTLAIVILSYAFLLFAFVAAITLPVIKAFVAAINLLVIKRFDKPPPDLEIGLTLAVAGVFFWQITIGIEAFAGLYGISLGRMLLAALIGLIVASLASLITTPLVFTPLLWLSLRFSKLWDLLFS
jgi:hypothetical protein